MVTVELVDSEEVYKIENRDLIGWVCPRLGNNLFRLRDKKAGREILTAPVSLPSLEDSPVMSGMPHLFPPNRIAAGDFNFNGTSFRLPVNTENGHHIHGIVLDKEWRFSTMIDREDFISLNSTLEGEIKTSEKGSVPLTFTCEYQFRNSELVTLFSVKNCGSFPLPVGYGLHTWFNLDNEAERWTLRSPVSKIWELGSNTMPTGRFEPLSKETEKLLSGLSLNETTLDTVFYCGDYRPIAELSRDDGYTIFYRASNDFKHWVFHTAGVAHKTIAIEPYTWVTNAPNLNVPTDQSGVIVLHPEEERVFRTEIEVRR